MSLFSKNGAAWYPHRESAVDIRPSLPPGNYTVKKNAVTEQFFLEEIDAFRIPEKIYGNITKQTNRVIRSFADREGTTGVLLAGEKGSGKTLLSKNICAELKKVGVPTIVINHPWYGDLFNSFIQSITQPAVIVFDEFEKVYVPKEQEQLLTLLDGVFSSKKLVILTCNDECRIDSHMKNRPGRIYYFMKFDGLDAKFIEEYCLDNLLNQEHVERVTAAAGLFHQFNFDMLQALVEEMNRFDETPAAALAMLNAKPEGDDGGKYRVQLIHQGVAYAGNDLDPAVYTGNPLQNGLIVEVRAVTEEAAENDDEEEDEFPANISGFAGGQELVRAVKARRRARPFMEFDFDVEHFVRFDPVNESFLFVSERATCILTRVREKPRHNFFAC